MVAFVKWVERKAGDDKKGVSHRFVSDLLQDFATTYPDLTPTGQQTAKTLLDDAGIRYAQRQNGRGGGGRHPDLFNEDILELATAVKMLWELCADDPVPPGVQRILDREK